jgi:hypothetical protein
MKTTLKTQLSKLILGLLSILFISVNSFAAEKIKPRLSVDYVKIMGEDPSLAINIKYKLEKAYLPGAHVELSIYENIDDSLNFIGKTTTDNEGNALYYIENLVIRTDSVIQYKYTVAIENNDLLKDADKSAKFIDGIIVAEAIVKDSMNYISATLTNSMNEPIEGEKLSLVLQRLFAPLTIGESSYKTDSDGNILVPIEDPMPGIDGVLTFEVTLDSRKYGIVKNIFEAPIGKVIVDQSTFDDRTMWSPPNKTPLFLWIFPNLVIFGIWSVIVILLLNIYKIYKS